MSWKIPESPASPISRQELTLVRKTGRGLIKSQKMSRIRARGHVEKWKFCPLQKDYAGVRSPPWPPCPGGVIGSRRRLKISRSQEHVGSSPTPGTDLDPKKWIHL